MGQGGETDRAGAPIPAARPVAPADVVDALAEVADTWVTLLTERGYRTHGDLAELRPQAPPDGTPHPDDVAADDVVRDLPGVLAEMLKHERDQRLTIARLEDEVGRLRDEAAPPVDPPGRGRRRGWRG